MICNTNHTISYYWEVPPALIVAVLQRLVAFEFTVCGEQGKLRATIYPNDIIGVAEHSIFSICSGR